MIDARLRVLYGDTDQMGVVYYANYLRYFELGRGEFFRARGGSYQAFERERGLFLPVVEVKVGYRAPARYDDLLVVRTWVAQVRRASLAFEYELRREGEGAVLAGGSTLHACVGRDGKARRLPGELVALLSPKCTPFNASTQARLRSLSPPVSGLTRPRTKETRRWQEHPGRS